MDSAKLGMMSREELIAFALSVQSRNITLESDKDGRRVEKGRAGIPLFEQIKRMIFGAKSERFVAPANPNQLGFILALSLKSPEKRPRRSPSPNARRSRR